MYGFEQNYRQKGLNAVTIISALKRGGKIESTFSVSRLNIHQFSNSAMQWLHHTTANEYTSFTQQFNFSDTKS